MIVDCKLPFSDKRFEKKITRAKFAIFLLWLISKKEMHGYEVIKTIRSDKAIPAVTVSKIYPLLKELTRSGLISQRKVMHGKRAKKIYRLTKAGKQTIKMAKDYFTKSPLMVQFAEDMMR